MSLDEVCDAIINLLPLSENNLGFVSPTHFVLQAVSIVEELRHRGHYPTIVYNTNGYDLASTIRSLDGIVDVWLPDFKYSDDNLAKMLSLTPDYSLHALASLKEMMYQAGTTLHTDESGIARRGIIVRHLVLPGSIENSIGVLRLIAGHLSVNLHISLMSQYYPPANLALHAATPRPAGRQHQLPEATGETLSRTVTETEYETVIGEFYSLGFSRGWVQEYESHLTYRPDFSKDQPFG
jgi:putative pyruvate formate lyase activating enzyme